MRPDLSGIDFRVKMLVSVSFRGYIAFKYYWRHCSYIRCFVGQVAPLSFKHPPQLVDWLHFTLNQCKILKHLRRLLRSHVTKLRMRVSNDSIWKGWPNFFKFGRTNSVAISSSWILAIREYFSLSTFLPCKIKNEFRYTNKKSDKIGLCVAWFQKSVRFSKIQYGGQLRITTE